MSERHTILDSITSAFVPIHPEGRKFILGFAVAALILFLLAASLSAAPPQSADGSGKTLLMTPRTFGTDGFFVAVLERK